MPLDRVLGLDSTTGLQGTAAFSLFGSRQLFADQLDNPNSSDWVVNALAPAVADPTNNGLTVRQFDDTTEQGISFEVLVPAEATNVRITIVGRAQTAPGGAVNVVMAVYNRGIPNNAALESWSSKTSIGTFAIPTNVNRQYFVSTIALSTITVTGGELTQFEITRDAANGSDTLTGNFLVDCIVVEFT